MWVFFDLNGTLVDPSVLLEPAEIPIAALDEANVMAMITTIAGRETAFTPLLDAALRRGLQRAGRSPEEAAGALEKLPRMPAYPDVPDALGALREAGFTLAVLTQSAADAAEEVTRNAGIRDAFELVLSAPALGAFTSPEVIPVIETFLTDNAGDSALAHDLVKVLDRNRIGFQVVTAKPVRIR